MSTLLGSSEDPLHSYLHREVKYQNTSYCSVRIRRGIPSCWNQANKGWETARTESYGEASEVREKDERGDRKWAIDNVCVRIKKICNL